MDSPESLELSISSWSIEGFFSFLRLQTFAKWFGLPHFVQVLPKAGQTGRLLLCVPPQYLQRLVSDFCLSSRLENRCFGLSFDAQFIASTSSGFSVTDLICCVVASLLLRISIARPNVTFFPCGNFLPVPLLRMSNTDLSRSGESCKQGQKLQDWASVRRAVTY